MKRDGHSKIILSLVDPCSATIPIVPELPLQEAGSLAFTARQHDRRPSCHGSGGSGRGPYCTFFPKVVTVSYRFINMHGPKTVLASVSISIYGCLFSLYFIFFIMLFDGLFVLMLRIVYLVSFVVN